MTTRQEPLDPLTSTTVSLAWLILINKPIYPLYIWYLVGTGVTASLGSLAAVPFFAATLLIASRMPLAARIGLPLVGALDTLYETKLFGHGAGTELFFAPCIMLVALGFRANEKWWQRAMAAFVFCLFVVSRCFVDSPLHLWSDAELQVLLKLNAFAVGSLMTFIAFRSSAVSH